MRNNKGITIAALIVAIIGLSIGFAAFSNTLTIRSTATVTPSESTMRVVFSLANNAESVGTTGSVEPTVATATYGDGGTIDNSTTGNSILKDLHAKFTAPGQSVKYNLYVVNVGSINGQISGVTFNNAQGVSTYKKCTAVTKQDTTQMATDSLVQSACNGISISVKVGKITATPLNPDLNHQLINVGNYLPVEVTISYDYGAAYVDGDMDVAFGDIAINVTSAVDNSLVPTNEWVLRGVTSPLVTFGTRYNLDDNEPDHCQTDYFMVNIDGSTTDPDGTTPSAVLDSMMSSQALKVGPNYTLIDVGEYYLVYDFYDTGKLLLTQASPIVPFEKDAIDAIDVANGKTICHYTLAQS